MTALVKVGQVGTLDLGAVEERANHFPRCPENAIRLVLAEARIKFRIVDMRNGTSSIPHLVLRPVRPMPKEHREVLKEIGPLPREIMVGPLLFNPE